MADQPLLERKLQRLTTYLEQLASFQSLTYAQFEEDATQHYAVERLLQLIVDEAIDINTQLLLMHRRAPAKDYYSSFLQLSALRVCSAAEAKRLALTTGLRNALVHEYEEVDSQEVFRNIHNVLNMYPAYVRCVLRHLKGRHGR